MNWPVFFTRTGTAIIFVIVMLFGLLYEHPTAILALAIIIQFIGNKELFRISPLIFPDQQFPKYFTWISIIASAYFIIVMLSKDSMSLLPLSIIPVIIFLLMALSNKKLYAAGITTLVGILYIGIPLGMLVDLRSIDKILPLGVIILIWVNDTMAYIVGSFIGKTPFSSISPKKTVEGTIGGMILTIIVAILLNYIFKTVYSWYDWAIMGAIVAIFGTLGDLLESQLKRKAGIKDSGNIMPGHGGILDRFDSLLVVIPIIYVYLQVFTLPRLLLP